MYLLLDFFFINSKKRIIYRTKKFIPKEVNDLYDTPLILRIMAPIVQILSRFIEKITPVKYKNHLSQKINYLNPAYTLQEILVMKFIILLIEVFCIYLYAWYYSLPNLVVIILMFSLTFLIPDVLINQSIKKKREAIQNELPFLMEMLVVILEGGIAFDSAIQKICQRKEGEVYTEFNRWIKEVKMGSSRREALQHMAQRIQLQEFDSFVRAILQAEKSGISIIQTVRLQAEQLRTKQKQMAKEKAMKIPLKILFPLIFFIFPPIFIVILGPGVIRILSNLF